MRGTWQTVWERGARRGWSHTRCCRPSEKTSACWRPGKRVSGGARARERMVAAGRESERWRWGERVSSG
ncbi:unnamed protein product, partial [Closterium sp. NIES-54]